MQSFNTNVSIKAGSPAEANQKLKALANLAKQLDGPTLEALSNTIPQVLADPQTANLVRGYLGI